MTLLLPVPGKPWTSSKRGSSLAVSMIEARSSNHSCCTLAATCSKIAYCSSFGQRRSKVMVVMPAASQAAARSPSRGARTPSICESLSPFFNFCCGCAAFHFFAKPAEVRECTTAVRLPLAGSFSTVRKSQTSVPRLLVGSVTSTRVCRIACSHCSTASPPTRP